MKPIKHVIYIPKNIFSEVDAILPFLIEYHDLAGGRGKLDVVYTDQVVHDEVAISDFHVDMLGKHARIWKFFPQGRGRTLKRPACLLALVTLIVWRRVTSGPIVFISVKKQSSGVLAWIDRIMGAVMRGTGHRAAFPGIQAAHTRRFMQREEPETFARRSVLEGVSGRLPPAPDIAIVYSEEHGQAYRSYRGWQCPMINIGFPRLYPAWQRAVAAETPRYFEREMRQLGVADAADGVITILLTYPHFIWFREEGAFFRLLREAIEVLQQAHPGIPIILKGKTRYLGANLFGDMMLPSGVYLSNVSLAVLASNTRLAVSIHETSGVFDFLSRGIPVVEYSEYAEAWLNLFPEGSPWLGLPGFRMAVSRSELLAAVTGALRSDQAWDAAQFGTAIGHAAGASRILEI